MKRILLLLACFLFQGQVQQQAALIADTAIGGSGCNWTNTTFASGVLPIIEAAEDGTEGGTCTVSSINNTVTPTKVSNQPGITYPNLPIGKYRMTAKFMVRTTNATDQTTDKYHVTAGTKPIKHYSNSS